MTLKRIKNRTKGMDKCEIELNSFIRSLNQELVKLLRVYLIWLSRETKISLDELIICFSNATQGIGLSQSLSLHEKEQYRMHLLELTIKDLKQKCLDQGHKVTGNKSELIGRIIGQDPVASTKKAQKLLGRKIDKKTGTQLDNRVAKLINKFKIRQVKINQNQYGNYMHTETKLVFDTKRMIVIGKQQGDSIIPLTDTDIETCYAMKLKFLIPNSLVSETFEDKQLQEELGHDKDLENEILNEIEHVDVDDVSDDDEADTCE